MYPLEGLAAVARLDVGVEEEPRGSNLGPQIAKFKLAVSYRPDDPIPWCAAAVCYWVQTYCEGNPDFNINMPMTAAAFGLIDWGRDQNCMIFSPAGAYLPAIGDVSVYTFSHCGIVSQPFQNGYFKAIEGNTNIDRSADGYGVFDHPRHLSEVKAFIRIPIRAHLAGAHHD